MGLIKRHARRLFRQRVQRPARVFLHNLLEQYCEDCKQHVQPFHTCSPRSDFKRRRGQQARAQARAEKSRSRRAATATTAAKTARAKRQGRRAAEHYKTCTDDQCERQLCIVFREGQASCRLPHQ